MAFSEVASYRSKALTTDRTSQNTHARGIRTCYKAADNVSACISFCLSPNSDIALH